MTGKPMFVSHPSGTDSTNHCSTFRAHEMKRDKEREQDPDPDHLFAKPLVHWSQACRVISILFDRCIIIK